MKRRFRMIETRMKSRRHFLANSLSTALGAAFSRTAFAKASAVSRPNLLLLFPDQWRFDWMTGTPGLFIRTPNLDRLAKAGIRLNNNIVASPLCAPSRACLASGRVYERCGVPNNATDYPYAEIPTFYGMLRDSGYHTLGCGKMDLSKASHDTGLEGKLHMSDWGYSDQINNPGKFDQLSSYKKNGNKPSDPYLTFLQTQGVLQEHLEDYRKRSREGYKATFPTILNDAQYCDNWLSRNGLDLLAAAPKDKPWFLQVNFTGPHDPEDITTRMEMTVRGRTMPPVNGKDPYDDATNQLIRQNYTAMCENIDRQVGIYLDWLEHTGQRRNTIVIFSSDHGEMLGDHGRWGKIVPFHASASTPLIISGPGVRRNAASDALTASIDIAGTCLDYAGVPIPASMEARSLRPLLEGKKKVHRDVVYLRAWQVADGLRRSL